MADARDQQGAARGMGMGGIPAFRQGSLRLSWRAGGGSSGRWQIVGRLAGERIRISTGTDDLQRAKQRLADLLYEHEGGWRSPSNSAPAWEAVARAMTVRHRLSARQRNIPFAIDAKLVLRMMYATDFRCSVSGIAFSRDRKVAAERDPWAPSIDRIENRAGYLPDNVRIVCLAANLAMNTWGYDTLLRLARGVARSALAIAAEPDAGAANSRHTATENTPST